ncbi:MAG: hypothetical protein ACR2GR_09740 [Rhodothermales bacterium]
MSTRSAFVFFVLLGLPALSGCELLLPSDADGATPGGVVYATSFETSHDLDGWDDVPERRREASSSGGAWSAYVSSGCTGPFPTYTLTAPEDGTLVLRAWARDLAIGGAVELENTRTSERLWLSVDEPGWASYQAEGVLTVRHGDTLRLRMSAGGFAFSAMLVDLLEVSQAE